MSDADQKPEPGSEQQTEVLHYAVPAPILRAAIDLIDEEINGKKGRRIVNALEQSPLIKPPE